MAGAPVVVNSILWGNSQPEISLIKSWGWVSAWNSDIQGGWEGEWKGQKNMNADPLFRDPDNGDFHLKEGSLCIDSGTPFAVWWPDTVLNLTPEDYVDFAPDMGAYEYSTPALLTLSKFTLRQNFPNPFNPRTTIRFGLPEAQPVTLTIYNILGQVVAVPLDNKPYDAGTHVLVLDAGRFSSGVYFYRIKAGKWIETRKMVVIK